MKSSAALLSPYFGGRRTLAGTGRVLILAYHRIVADIGRAEREAIFGLSTSVETFRQQLQLVREQCEVLTLDEAVEVLRGERRVGRPAAVITFDDGYRDFYDQAWPVLQSLNLPATVFLPTAYVGTSQVLDHDRSYWLVLKAREQGLDLRGPLVAAGLPEEKVKALCSATDLSDLADGIVYLPAQVRASILLHLEAALGSRLGRYPSGFDLLSWEMVEELANSGVTFGAHTDRHLVLTLETEETVEREVVRSKQVLEARLDQPARYFAYPNGRYNQVVKKMLARAGFEVAVTTERRRNHRGDDLLSLGRLSLCEESARGVTGRFSPAVARLRFAA